MACKGVVYEPLADPVRPCDSLETRVERLRIEARTYRGEGVTEAEVSAAVGMLAGRVSSWGIDLVASGPSTPVAASLLGQHPASGDQQLAPLEAFLEAEARPRDTTLRFVVLRELVDPRSPLARTLVLDGLGLHPDAMGSPEGEVVRSGIGGAAFSPILLVDADVVAEQVGGRALLAHELGHALGLGHDAEVGNAMHPTLSPGCAAGLRASQLEALLP